MFRVLGNPRRLCNGLTRRDWLEVGALSALGISAQALSSPSAQAEPANVQFSTTFGKAKSCILLLPYGSPPQHETFDPKPHAPANVRGEIGCIDSKLPGIQICELLPRVSQVMDRLTVVRSMTHPYPVHCTAYVVSGIPDYSPALETRPNDPKLWPFIGSVVDYVDERRSSNPPTIPRNMALPWKMNSRGGTAATVQAGPFAAFLGSAYNPVLTDFEGEGTRTIDKVSPNNGPTHKVKDPYAGIKPDGRFRFAGTDLAQGVTIDRLKRRVSLREQLDTELRQIDERAAASQSFDRFQNLALALSSSSKVVDALNIQQESAALRESYGMTLFGQSCLAARRLVAAGSRFVTVFWDEYAYLNTDWDTHWNHFYRLKDRLLPGFDLAFSGLILDLEQRGLLDETLVVWMSEHGRTPNLNNNKGGGRDHWSRVYSIALAGAGIGQGNIVGRSDEIGGDVAANPVSPKDILATIYHLLGIHAHTTVPNRVGQPMPVAGTGHVRGELFG
jgi:hypothetical protein